MHREILGLTDSKIQVDHKDGNTLDNQRRNLRTATVAKNQQNRQKRVRCSSKFKGVCWHKGTSKWLARITPPDQKQALLGSYDDEETAAKAYNEAAKRLFGEFALTNVVGGDVLLKNPNL